MTWDTLTKRFMEIVQDMAPGQRAFSTEHIDRNKIVCIAMRLDDLIWDAKQESPMVKGETK